MKLLIAVALVATLTSCVSTDEARKRTLHADYPRALVLFSSYGSYMIIDTTNKTAHKIYFEGRSKVRIRSAIPIYYNKSE